MMLVCYLKETDKQPWVKLFGDKKWVTYLESMQWTNSFLQVPGFDDQKFLEILRFVLWIFFWSLVTELWDPWSWTTQTSFREGTDWIPFFFFLNFSSTFALRPCLPSTAPHWQHGWGIKADVSLRDKGPPLAVQALKQLYQTLSCVVLVASTQTFHLHWDHIGITEWWLPHHFLAFLFPLYARIHPSTVFARWIPHGHLSLTEPSLMWTNVNGKKKMF